MAKTSAARKSDTLLSDALHEKLRCVECRGSLSSNSRKQALGCTKCKLDFPIRHGRFPDFLNQTQRDNLAKEISFWHKHYDGKVYQDENDASYRHIASLMGVKASDEIIELGCGSGALLWRVTAAVKMGVEPAEGLLTATRGFEGIIAAAEKLPFADESFDFVYFKHSLHHVQDKETAIREAIRITRKGGKFMVCEPNLAHPQRRLTANPENPLRKWHILTHFIGPVETFQTAAEVQRLSEKYGTKHLFTEYYESSYKHLTVFQALQKIYSRVLSPFLDEKYLMPNYFMVFKK